MVGSGLKERDVCKKGSRGSLDLGQVREQPKDDVPEDQFLGRTELGSQRPTLLCSLKLSLQSLPGVPREA